MFVRRGFASISLVFLLQLFMAVLLLLQVRLQILTEMKKQTFELELIEIELVNHLKQTLANYQTEEEALQIQGIEVNINYGELEAFAEIHTDPIRQLHVVYDDIWMCISEFEYVEGIDAD